MGACTRLTVIAFMTACAASTCGCVSRSARDAPEGENPVTKRYIIRAIKLAHCKRGPQRCEKCREMDVEKICLLDIAPDDYGLLQRRMIEVEWEGERTLREFDIVKTFESEDEAREYARENHIADVKYERE
jgi:hypothetical protein